MAKLETILDTIARDEVQRQLNRIKDYGRERPSDEEIEHATGLERAKWARYVEEFADLEVVWGRHGFGWFHPSNKRVRKLFTAYTGVKLPRNRSGIDAAIRGYVGDEVIAKAERMVQEAQAEKDRLAAEAAAREAAELAARVATAKQSIRQGLQVSGAELLEVAEAMEFDVHPRTVGTIRQRVRSIGRDSARIHGSGKIDGAWKLLQLIEHGLQDEAEENEPEDAEVMALFGQK